MERDKLRSIIFGAVMDHEDVVISEELVDLIVERLDDELKREAAVVTIRADGEPVMAGKVPGVEESGRRSLP